MSETLQDGGTPPVDRIRLRVRRGARRGEVFEIGRGELVVVGRSREADISIDSPGLSRRHFTIEWDGSRCIVRDLQSQNGIRINGAPAVAAVVAHGDSIEAADTEYVVELRPMRRRIVDEDASDVRAPGLPVAAAAAGDEPTLTLPVSVFD